MVFDDREHYPMKSAQQVAMAIKSAGGKAYLAGGAVRDRILGRAPKDLDLEVYGLSRESLKTVLLTLGTLNEVGASFGVYKLKIQDQEFDISLPRRDSKISEGHKGFRVEVDPGIDPREACSRRDFTLNAMLEDPLEGKILDFYGGQKDLEDKILRHTSDAFPEDPLRVLRGVQFAARFELSMAEETKKLCRGLNLSELPKERIWEEWSKLLLLAQKPSIGIILAHEIGALKMFPELLALRGVLQEPEWHPEGDVWEHNLMVIDEAAGLRTGENKEDLILMWAALCHDLGKVPTTKVIGGKIRSRGHSEQGIPLALNMLSRVTDDKEILDGIVPLIQYHLTPTQYYLQRDQISDSAIRRLSLRVPIERLIRVAQADHFGRTTPDALAREFPGGDWLRQRAEDLKVKDEAPKPILSGRHCLERGMKPGPAVGQLLKEAFEAQLDGVFQTQEEALEWLGDHLGKKNTPS